MIDLALIPLNTTDQLHVCYDPRNQKAIPLIFAPISNNFAYDIMQTGAAHRNGDEPSKRESAHVYDHFLSYFLSVALIALLSMSSYVMALCSNLSHDTARYVSQDIYLITKIRQRS